MADIELVVKIEEERYNQIKRCADNFLMNGLERAIKHGTPLPKGHGRLIDADALEKRMLDREVELKDDRALWESSAVETALDMFAPTVIEADIESEG